MKSCDNRCSYCSGLSNQHKMNGLQCKKVIYRMILKLSLSGLNWDKNKVYFIYLLESYVCPEYCFLFYFCIVLLFTPFLCLCVVLFIIRIIWCTLHISHIITIIKLLTLWLQWDKTFRSHNIIYRLYSSC